MNNIYPQPALSAIALTLFSLISVTKADEGWPGFRGHGNSLAASDNLPVTWQDESVSWRAELPGTGQSSPVRWHDRLFTTVCSGSNKERLLIVCHHRKTGEKLWQRQFPNSAPEAISNYISFAAPTPVVDTERLYVLFEGGDLVALAHDGSTVWRRELARDYGPFEGNHGQGASPVLSRHGLVVVMDHKGDSFIANFDRRTGKTLWKTARDTSSAWASPVIRLMADGQEEIVCSASDTVIGYDPATGSIRWSYRDITGNNVPTATVYAEHLALGSNTKFNSVLLNVKNGEPQVRWKADEATSSFGSPLIHRGRVYFVNRAGIVFCYELESGRLLFDHRLPASTWASPLGSGERVWFFGNDGSTVVMKCADTPVVESTASLTLSGGDRIYGYALSEDAIVFRTKSELICIERPAAE